MDLFIGVIDWAVRNLVQIRTYLKTPNLHENVIFQKVVIVDFSLSRTCESDGSGMNLEFWDRL
jgi:hypothetical protein